MRLNAGFLALGASALLALSTASPSGAQDAPPVIDACLLTLDEVSAIVGSPMVGMAGAGNECAYSADLSVDLLAVWIGVVPADPAELGGPMTLSFVRATHEAGGREATVAGLPAWLSDDGVWVDAGGALLSVWPLFAFHDDPPPVAEVALAMAELAVPRYLALPPASAP